MVSQVGRSHRRAYRHVGCRSCEEAVSDRRHLGTLHVQGWEPPFPDDERPQRRRAAGGPSPAGAVTAETFSWWKKQVESSADEIVVTCHHHMLRETTVGSGDYEGVSKNPDGTYRSGKYHGPDGAPEGRHTFTSWTISRRHRHSKATWLRILVRSTSGSAATPTLIPTTC